MLIFWISAAILILLALAFVIPPLLKKTPKSSEVDNNSLNLAIYKQRIAELEQENLTSEQFTQAKQELEKSLAEDLDDKTTLVPKARARWAAAIMVILAIPSLAIGVYWEVGFQNFLIEKPKTATTTTTPHSVNQMLEGLLARLEKDPNDKKGWYMLARSYSYMKQYDKAAQAYNKLLGLVGDKDPQVLTELARALTLGNNGQFVGQPRILLKLALEANPNYQEALWLSGLAAAQNKSYQAAIAHWQKFLQQIPADKSQSRQMLEQHIAEARRQLGEPTVKQQLVVHVSLDPSLEDKVQANDTLFIYARAVTGSAMPLAIVRKKASELPTEVILDDSTAMMPAMKLSNFKEVKVLARISHSGSAKLESGDLQGEVSPVALDTKEPIKIIINTVVP
ncbi:c-type cytochrome biogenesis protein CcmI [Candidatus Marithrix sp. Canyon 246]|uniref:c-type cytochrome biogenesis protein CcmI n=1 Tax=Candidatus Marithrix sp. Canyon 246 TaxID=1827136 RepID=UPI00084A1823|nr:c-type cytochrome biogenesis protein CcmI [Candidatus Marithrix sp. Canyon 246]